MPASQKSLHRGQCYCGAVRYRVDGPLRSLVACHCGQCRRTSGNFVVASAARRADMSIEGEAALTWFTSSPGARRGFCKKCGSNLFWDLAGRDQMSIFAGSLDQPSGLQVVSHIFVADKADFTKIEDGLPTHDQGRSQTTMGGG